MFQKHYFRILCLFSALFFKHRTSDVCSISTVLSLGNLVKRNEWTAMKASGISIYRVAIPLILSGFVLSGFSFLLDNKLVSHGNEKRFDIDRDYVKRKSRHKIKNTLKNLIFQKT